MKKHTFIILILMSVIIGLGCYIGLSKKSQPVSVAYVNLETVYNDFTMKKELESKLTNVQQLRKRILDSLKVELNMISQSIRSDKQEKEISLFEAKRQQYLEKKEHFDQDNKATTDAYSAQIWKQINQYTKDYGKVQGYTVVLGIDGQGSVMYADEKNNITSELSDYINKRYAGEKK